MSSYDSSCGQNRHEGKTVILFCSLFFAKNNIFFLSTEENNFLPSKRFCPQLGFIINSYDVMIAIVIEINTKYSVNICRVPLMYYHYESCFFLFFLILRMEKKENSTHNSYQYVQ